MKPMQIDSNLTQEQAVRAKQGSTCDEAILQNQAVLDVQYFNFEGIECTGQIVIASKHVSDIKELFSCIYNTRFPIAKVIPIADPHYAFDDVSSCNDNNSSGFNYRVIAGTDRLSNHALGNAFDINPLHNPYIKYDMDSKELFREPKNAVYDTSIPGTLHATHEIVLLLKQLGWSWGGDWTPRDGPIDYQHFEKK